MIVYDIVVNGEVKETIRPQKLRLKELYAYMLEQSKQMKMKYGENTRVLKRILY
ncbi:mechanosensitive ion channel protein MscL [Paenibacillus chitinolyticus]|uniref:Mechanosensitive ion channel protein MscL n=1 Tax=Paenibacillus chitinolyticus TaxID=79263 RepID=A0A410X2L2_9BACL|nr:MULTISPECIES: hypothetical protein [Paenibacillus]EGL15353.1 hypothetical protein HMPREF9413_1316 [Paenibacillus sp. HGF7]EPD89664.1 hypothetical protein HMPREF1207_01513 [Paenibacillus sp. HGH0039]MBV6712158.1 mechanosensitive ion channel protein MscL [Paenibacillus chitinolyticus]MCY9591398.1 mechanosensitive ion channel protein MscL [Paenibacillus chitinolyticus]MCY9599387.1 mechanosensitive ion channel protein MscL [Paenibacillus chitinolyticus]